MNNSLIKVLISLPVILMVAYLVPALGFVLVIARYIIKQDRRLIISLGLIIASAVLYVPKILLNINHQALAWLKDVDCFKTDFYGQHVLGYAKNLLIIAIISALVMTIALVIKSRLTRQIGQYFDKLNQRDYQIARDNNLKIQEKQQRAKQTAYVQCPNCGSDNLVSETQAVCKFCRTPLINPKLK